MNLCLGWGCVCMFVIKTYEVKRENVYTADDAGLIWGLN